MDNDELHQLLLDTMMARDAAMADGLARTSQLVDRMRDELAGLRAMLATVVEVLVARGDLAKGHPALLEKIRKHTKQETRAVVRLTMLDDKYNVPNSGVDCPSLLHLCHGRCCSFSVVLSKSDILEGQLKWKVDEPYMLLRDDDGYCAHIERQSLGCTAYEHRPATCRSYDCRNDSRVWIDFDKRIPAPMPVGVTPPDRT